MSSAGLSNGKKYSLTIRIATISSSWIAVRELGYSGADVARYLGVTNSCVTRFVASGQKPDVNDLIKNL
jgi:predicted transcriptional regulator